MAIRVLAPLTGSVSTGSWITNQRINVGAMPNGFMQYNYLLPAQYDSSGNTLYPILFTGGGNDQGMNGSAYPRDGGVFVSAVFADSSYNTVAFRTAHPCIIVAVQCDQSLDLSGANGNANFGGYADSQNSGGNEQGVNAVLQFMIANFPVDPGRRYGVGLSLSAIGVLSWLVDNNQYNGPSGLGLWTAGIGMSEQLQRPGTPNSSVFARMASVPYLAISTGAPGTSGADNDATSYDQPAFRAYANGSTNYPTRANYDSGGMAAIRAGTSQFYYINTNAGSPWLTFMAMNADGGDGTVMYQWLFSQIFGAAVIQTGNFRVSNGGVLLTPSGSTFLGGGINVRWQSELPSAVTNSACQPLTTLFPGINIIRLAYEGPTAPYSLSGFEPYIGWLTAAGIVVLIEDHTGISATPYTGTALAAETAWYASLATTYASNPYVWFGTFNEPGAGTNLAAITTQEVAIYNAIRNAGCPNVIAMEIPSGGNNGLVGTAATGFDGLGPMTAASYATMTNIVWDMHFYGFIIPSNSTDLPTILTKFIGSVASAFGVAAVQSITSKDGLVPVIIGEFGNSTDGINTDANGSQVCQVVGAQAGVSTIGYMAWDWNNVGGDILVSGNQLTSPYGTQIAGLIATTAAQRGSTPTPTATNYITPGSGSFTDAASHVYTLTAAGVATEDGQPMAGGNGTSAMEYSGGVVYAQDANTLSWYTWNGTAFVGPVAAPPPPTTPVTPTPTPTAGTTQVWNNPGADGRFWKLPQQTTAIIDTTSTNAKIMRNGVSGSTPIGSVNTSNNFAAPFYQASATDPVVTVVLGSKSLTTRLPLGAIVEQPFVSTDASIGGTDQSKPGLVWSMSGVTMKVNGVAVSSVQASGTVLTGTYGLQIDWGFGPFMEDATTGQPGAGNAYGNVQDYELTQAVNNPNYVIGHTLACQLDDSQASKLIVWPLNAADGSVNFTGPLPQGQTYMIPANIPRPTGMTRGQALLFDTLQQMGIFVYNFGATGGGLNITVYSTLASNAALVSDIVSHWTWAIQYLGILTNQTGPSSAKGMVNGVRSDAFPAPAVLDLTSTGGVEVSSATVGGYYPTTTIPYSFASGGFTNPAPIAAASLTVVTPTQQNAGAPFAISGTIVGYASAPTLNFSDDGAVFVALPAGFAVTATSFSFTNPGLAAGAQHTITVRDANNVSVSVATGPFSVVAVATPVITPTAPSLPATGIAFTISGTQTNYGAAPSLTYSDNGGAPVALPVGSPVTASTFSFLHPGLPAGSYTTVIADGGGNQGSIGYSVTSIAGGTSPNLSTVTTTTGSFIDGAGNRWSISTSGRAVVSGAADTTSSNVVQLAWVNTVIWYKNAAGLWFSRTSAAAAWSTGTTTNPLANVPTIAITSFATPVPNSGFTVTGILTNYGISVPTLTYSDNGGPATAFPVGSSVSSTAFSFVHPGLATGSYTLAVADGVVSPGTFSYAVSTPGWNSLPATTNFSNTITGLNAATAYDIQIYAANAIGQSPTTAIITATTASIPVVIPGVPTGLTSTAVGQTTVNLSWSAPSTGTPPFTYGTRSSLHSANTWTAGPTVSTTTAQITGLSAGTIYDFEVDAINTAGTSAFSPIYAASTVVPPATVTWNAASINGPITLSNGNLTATTSGSSTPYAQRQVVLSTTSIASGNGSFEITLPSLTQNCAVGLVTSTHTGLVDLGGDATSIGYYMSTGTGSQAAQTMFYNGLLVLAPPGNAPAADVGGATFTFCVNRDTSLWWVTGPAMQATYGANAWNDSATASPATGVGGVSFSAMSGALYIAFHSAEGGGVAVLNAGSSAFTRAGSIPSTFPPWSGSGVTIVAPGQVTGLTAGTATTSSVPLTWTAPATGTPPYTYLVMQSPHSAGTFVQVVSTTSTSATVSGLATATAYDLRVIATNSAGSGTASAILSVTTATTVVVPGAPIGVSATSETSSSISLTWQVPSTGSAPTGYQVQYKLTSAGTYTPFGATTAFLSQTITGLAASSAYNIQVYAFNTAGNGVVSAPALTVSTTAVVSTATLFSDTFVTLDVSDAGGAATGTTQTVLAGSGGSFTDGSGNVWTIVSGAVFENGSAAAFTANVAQLSLVNGTVWHENTSSQWYFWTGTAWTAGTNPLSGGATGTWMNHYAFGGSEYTLSANGELQYYASSSRTPGFTPFALQNAGAGPGLVITVDSVAHTVANPLGLPFNSGEITSAIEVNGEPTPGLFSFTYGYIEVQALLPAGPGMWVGFAMYPFTGSGELDIIETAGANLTNVFCSIHSSTGGQSVAAPVTDYSVHRHKYGTDWQTNFITWYVDGVQVAQIATPSDFIGKPYYIALDLAIQGNPSLGFSSIITPVPTPRSMLIDYVKVWKNFAASVAAPATNFSISNGHIIGLDGNIFIANGINIYMEQLSSAITNSACQPLTTLFPGLNQVRIVFRNSWDTSTATLTAIARLTALKIVVVLDDHVLGNSAPVATGATLTQELAWFTFMANTFKTNPYVWCQSQNEPGNGTNLAGIAQHEVDTYNAVRNTGNNNIVVLQVPSGGNKGLVGANAVGYDGLGPMTPSAYAAMRNIVWDMHFYDFITVPANSANTTVIQAALVGTPTGGLSGCYGTSAVQTIRSADGLVPVIIGEFGPSTDGTNVDAGGSALVGVVMASGLGFSAFTWYPGFASGNNMTTTASGTLTTYGQQVAAGIAS